MNVRILQTEYVQKSRQCDGAIKTRKSIAKLSWFHRQGPMALSPSYCRIMASSHHRFIVIASSSQHHCTIAPSTQTSMVRWCKSKLRSPIQISQILEEFYISFYHLNLSTNDITMYSIGKGFSFNIILNNIMEESKHRLIKFFISNMFQMKDLLMFITNLLHFDWNLIFQ